MAKRKRWTPETEVTPELLKFREKRKWQINLRRYVLQQSPCFEYAPYFGIDIKGFRNWIQMQFTGDLSWDNFGKNWQFDHIVPVTFFDFSNDGDLRLCWNFTNIRVEEFQKNKDRSNRLDVLAAKGYFEDLYEKSRYTVCKKMLEKIETLEISAITSIEKQQAFLLEMCPYLEMIENYSAFEFELLNSGRDLEEVKKEIEFLRRL